MKLRSPAGLHPFLLAAAPAIYLFCSRFGFYGWKEFAYCIGVSLLSAAAFAIILSGLIKSRQMRTMVMSCIIVFLFAYSNFVSELNSFIPIALPRNSFVYLVIWSIPLVVCIYVIMRLNNSLVNLNKIGNVFAICLVVLSGFKAAAVNLQNQNLAEAEYSIPALQFDEIKVESSQPRPNIFFIVLDQHVGDTCLQRYGYDNSRFLKALEDRGFYAARESHSNYWMTNASTASFLNYDFLDFKRQTNVPTEINYYLSQMKNNNRVFAFMKKQGYVTAHCQTDFIHGDANVHTADLLISPDPWYMKKLPRELFGNTPFYMVCSRIFDKHPDTWRSDLNSYLLRRNINNALEYTKQMADFDKQFILFSHFLCPHGPWVFNENGGFSGAESVFNNFEPGFCNKGTEDDLRRYLAQLAYIDNQMLRMIDYIKQNSKRPPIIILMGDHGNRLKIQNGSSIEEAAPELYSILNAVYLPDGDYSRFYPSISPVNMFRVIFNQYFGADYEMLPDRAFYTSEDFSHSLRDVTEFIK